MIMMTPRDRTTSVALDDPAPISRRSHALANGLAVGFDAGLDPRLVQFDDAREDETAYRAKGGYQAARSGQTLIQAVEEANLRGRGGAAFPTAVKLATLARSEGPKFVIANGDEGEPASIKDRWLMRARPHQVLDGVLLAADAIGADKAYLYVSDDDSAASLQAAITEAGTTVIPLEICKVERSYVGGEETSAVRFINGGPAKPGEGEADAGAKCRDAGELAIHCASWREGVQVCGFRCGRARNASFDCHRRGSIPRSL
jgi:Na+-translocating ferredoxin:NAD+ oxidoreductase RnfC subunit